MDAPTLDCDPGSVPALIIPCYDPCSRARMVTSPSTGQHLLRIRLPRGMEFPSALHEHGYGTYITTLHLQYEQQVRELLGIPASFNQGCLLPVRRLRNGRSSSRRPAGPPKRSSVTTVGANGYARGMDRGGPGTGEPRDTFGRTVRRSTKAQGRSVGMLSAVRTATKNRMDPSHWRPLGVTVRANP